MDSPVDPANRRIWIEKGTALAVIRRYFSEGHSLIRIAAGFFTIRGYNLIRGAARGKQMRILVGIEEPGELRARKLMIDQILYDLRTGRDQDRYHAVVDFVEKLRAGTVKIVDARALDHHAKIYIVDEAVVIVASSNVSQRGFVEAIRSGTVNSNYEDVLEAIRDYEEHFNRAQDITADLLARLEDWLLFRKPWEVYLKTLDVLNVLEDIPDTKPKPNYRSPVSFQLSIVAIALRQIYTYGGAMVVASTGLGKTIIATDIARRLHLAGAIRNILVLAPSPVQEEWKRRLRSAGITPEIMTSDIWDRQDATQVDDFLSDLDDGWLFIIDESHVFRNRFKNVDNKKGKKKQKRHEERLVFRRLVPAINQHQCKILLLTATPFSTTVDNINNQLHLLPHNSTRLKGQMTLFSDTFAGDNAWRIEEAEELRDLEVASVLTTPSVAKHWADHENGSAYVTFGSERQYFPKVTLFRSDIPPVLEHEIATLLAKGCFKIEAYRPSHRTLIEKIVRVAWGSSPKALKEVLQKTISPDGYEASFEKTRFSMNTETRQLHIQPVIDLLDRFSFDDDLKLRQFFAVLIPILAEGKKVVVFSEQHATVTYLTEALEKLHPEWRVGSTITTTSDGKYRMRTQREVTQLIERFAPVANKSIKSDAPVDVFLSTDAHGVGVNMQDAAVVINYDLAWTPIEPAQRAGRILRLWHEPRTIQLYAFVPYISSETQALLSEVNLRPIQLVAQRWATLIARHTWSSQILELPILTTNTQQDVDLLHLPTVKVDASTIYLEEMAEVEDSNNEIETSPILTRHVSRYERHKKEARKLPSDIISAKVYKGSNPLIYVLLRHFDQIFWAVFDLTKKNLLPHTEYQLLNLIEASPDDQPAFIDMAQVEAASDECIQAWHQKNKHISLDEITRECALYIKPDAEQDLVSGLLQ